MESLRQETMEKCANMHRLMTLGPVHAPDSVDAAPQSGPPGLSSVESITAM